MADFETRPTSIDSDVQRQFDAEAVPAAGDGALPTEGDAAAVDLRAGGPVVDLSQVGPVVLDRLPRVRLFGLDFVSCGSVAEVNRRLLEGAVSADGRDPLVLTPNVDIMVHLDRHPVSPEAEAFRRAQYCLPDGQPLVWASRLVGRRLQARLPGSGLFADLWPKLVAERRPVVVVASSDQVADGLRHEHPAARFVVPPVFDVDDSSTVDAIVSDIVDLARQQAPDFVLLGIGHPKDARIATSLLRSWPADIGPKPMTMGLGGSFRLYLGHTKRAPKWVQRIGMEWFHRFLQEPRRLFHRYFITDPAFVGIVRREMRAGRSGRVAAGDSGDDGS